MNMFELLSISHIIVVILLGIYRRVDEQRVGMLSRGRGLQNANSSRSEFDWSVRLSCVRRLLIVRCTSNFWLERVRGGKGLGEWVCSFLWVHLSIVYDFYFKIFFYAFWYLKKGDLGESIPFPLLVLLLFFFLRFVAACEERGWVFCSAASSVGEEVGD